MQKGKILIASVTGLLAAFPVVLFAAETTNGLAALVGRVSALIQGVIPLIIGLAVLMFLWGVFLWFFVEKNKDSGREFMIWGIIALFVMVSVWGLVRMLQSAVLQGDENRALPAPQAFPAPSN